jgi:multicomponent Na+:H+ antiporter subunit E
LIRFFALFIALSVTWLLWSGIYDDPKILGLGMASCLGVVALTARMKGGDFESAPPGLWLRLLIYSPWIIWEIAKANVDVTLCVLGVRPISPRLIRVPTTQKTALGLTLYANSITLTPGTISLDVRDNHILVHALTADTAAGLADGNMDRKSTWVEGGRA